MAAFSDIPELVKPRPLRARVVGLHQNVPLILELARFKDEGRLDSLQVCSPLRLNVPLKAATPQVCMSQVTHIGLIPGSLGGWHEFEAMDRFAYDLAAGGAVQAEHPLIHRLRFVQGLNLEATGKLIGAILDPRWFVDDEKPDNIGKLYKYLGLSPYVQEGVSGGGRRRFGHERCELVLSCWHDNRPMDGIAPRSFLWRVLLDHGMDYKGELRASQLFVQFLRAVWLQLLCHGYQEMAPELLFTSDVAAAYRAYLKLE